MKKLKEYLIKKIFLNLFLLLFVAVVYSIISGVVLFYNTDYSSELLKLFVRINILNDVIYFIPALILTIFFYILNVYFSSKKIAELKIKLNDIYNASFLLFFIFLFFSILIIELVSLRLNYYNDKLNLLDKKIKIYHKKENVILDVFEKIEKLIQKEKYYEAVDKVNDILFFSPENKKAKELLKFLKEKIKNNKENEVKKLKAEGIKLYDNGKYKEASLFFNKILMIVPQEKEALRYLTLISENLSIKTQLLIKDRYNTLVKFYNENSPTIIRNRKMYYYAQLGKEYFKKGEFQKAREMFKKIRLLDIYNYDANVYLERINKRLQRINYFTNREDKLIKKNIFLPLKKDRKVLNFLIVKELRKSFNKDYILYYPEIYKVSNEGYLYSVIKKKYGYYDYKKKKYILLNSFIHYDKNLIFLSRPDFELYWHTEDMLITPEKFSIVNIWKLMKSSYLHIDEGRLIFILKLNFYILIIFLFFMLLPLSYKLRLKKEKKNYFINLIYLPILAFIFYKLFYFTYYFLKKILYIAISFNNIYIFIFNIGYYLVLYLIFKIISLFIERPQKEGKDDITNT